MLIQPTLDALNRLKLHGMALALSEQMTNSAPSKSPSRSASRSCSSAKSLHRETRRMGRLLQRASSNTAAR